MPVFGDQEYPEEIRLANRFLDLPPVVRALADARGLVTGLVMARSSKRYAVMVDGAKRNYVIKPFSTLRIMSGSITTPNWLM